MKKFSLIPPSICALCFLLGLSACKSTNTTTSSSNYNSNNSTSSIIHYNPSNSSASLSETPFSLTINIENYTVNQNEISLEIPEEIHSYSFANSFTIPSNYKWELHWDKECLSSLNIVSKTVDLKNEITVLYALFINKNDFDDVYLYTINIKRLPAPSTFNPNSVEDAIRDAEAYANDRYNNESFNHLPWCTPSFIQVYLEDLGYLKNVISSAIENCNIDWRPHAKRLVEAELSQGAGEESIKIQLFYGNFEEDLIYYILSKIDWETRTINL